VGLVPMLTTATRERLRGLLESAAADASAPPDGSKRKMGDLYAGCMDTTAIDAGGLTPLQPDFARIAAIESRADLVSALIAFQRSGRPFADLNGVVVGPFRVTSGQDVKNPDRVVARIVERDFPGRTGTSILSLPDRDYDVKEDGASNATRDAFVIHATHLLELAGAPHADAEREAQVVLAFETALARSVMTNAERRDPDKTYHLMDATQLRDLAPLFDWTVC